MRLLPYLCAALLTGCGVTMGDSCTVTSECDTGTCLNRDFTPGGYCTKACVIGQPYSCPAGTACVNGVLGRDQPGCMRSCAQGTDCRNGYVCRTENNSATPVCIGPAGL